MAASALSRLARGDMEAGFAPGGSAAGVVARGGSAAGVARAALLRLGENERFKAAGVAGGAASDVGGATGTCCVHWQLVRKSASRTRSACARRSSIELFRCCIELNVGAWAARGVAVVTDAAAAHVAVVVQSIEAAPALLLPIWHAAHFARSPANSRLSASALGSAPQGGSARVFTCSSRSDCSANRCFACARRAWSS